MDLALSQMPVVMAWCTVSWLPLQYSLTLCRSMLCEVQCIVFFQGQLAYCMTYCCYVLMNMERKVNSQLCLRDLLLSYTALALELGRFRTSAPVNQISENEHKWLHYLEGNLSSYLQSNMSRATTIFQAYMEAFRKVCVVPEMSCISFSRINRFDCFNYFIQPDLQLKFTLVHLRGLH